MACVALTNVSKARIGHCSGYGMAWFLLRVIRNSQSRDGHIVGMDCASSLVVLIVVFLIVAGMSQCVAEMSLVKGKRRQVTIL